MINDTISDSRIQRMLVSHLKKHASKRTEKLKGIELCGSRILTFPGMAHNVYVTSNGENASFFGTATCHSAWACPRCSAKVMANKAAKIACLIDAEATWNKEYAFMITFTLPHVQHMYCNETFNILRQTWRLFSKQTKKAAKSGGITQSPYTKFRNDFNIKYNVKVYDFTWGKNGWHPHIHALFFTKPENFPELIKHEDELNRHWFKAAQYTHFKALEKRNREMSEDDIKKILLEINLQEIRTELKEEIKNCRSRSKIKKTAIRRLEVVEKTISSKNINEISKIDSLILLDAQAWIFVTQLYSDWRKKPKSGHRSVYFSKDKNGNVRRESSSRYISGWGGNSELTRTDIKKAHEGHFTPFQMLTEAQKTKDPETKEKWLNLFVEYALATRGYRRCEFSPNCGKLIAKWQESEEYMEIYKKKFMAEETAKWKTVYWFNEKQWKDALLLEEKKIHDLREQILKLACENDARNKICEYLWHCGITDINLEPHEQEDIINNYLSFAPPIYESA